MDIEALKQRVISEIDKNAERIIEIGERIKENPEMGYKENKTAKYVKAEFSKLGTIQTSTSLERAYLASTSPDVIDTNTA